MRINTSRLRVIYVLYRFPALSETFIARELEEVHKQDVDLTIMSLLQPKPGPRNQAAELMSVVQYTPGVGQLVFWWAQLYFCLRQPRLLLRLLVTVLRQPYRGQSVKQFGWRIYLFMKGVATAYLLKDTDFDLLHTHFAAWPGLATLVIARLLDRPFTITAGHGYDLYTPSSLIELIAPAARHIITVADQRRQEILARCPDLPPDKVTTIPCSINPEQFPTRRTPSDGPLRLVSVGRLIEAKGHEYLVRACGQLQDLQVNFRCTIIGAGTPDAEKNLDDLVHRLRLEDKVQLCGARTSQEILSTFAASDIFVLACVIANDNTRDATPVVLVEAAATGLPLISSSIGGVSEIVVDGVTGILTPERDVAALTQAILQLAHNPQLRVQMGKQGRALVEAHFDSRKNALKIMAIFCAAVSPPNLP
jgi:colanic acid/amylovoran biosynthesis glycosyltransferase